MRVVWSQLILSKTSVSLTIFRNPFKPSSLNVFKCRHWTWSGIFQSSQWLLQKVWGDLKAALHYLPILTYSCFVFLQRPWLLTMKLEPDTSIASFPLKKPLWCYIEDKCSECAIQVRGSPTDCLTPAVSTNTLWLRSDSLWVFTEAKSNHKRGKTHPAALISEGVFLFFPPQIMPKLFKQWALSVHIDYTFTFEISSEKSHVRLHVWFDFAVGQCLQGISIHL